MADTPLNSGTPAQFHQGGILRISIGATDYALRLAAEGTLRFTAGMEELRDYDDGGVPQRPNVGNRQPSEIDIDARVALQPAGQSADDLWARLTAAAVSGQPAALDKVEVDMPEFPYAATGRRYSWADCWVLPPVTVQDSAEFVQLQVRLRSATARPTVSDY